MTASPVLLAEYAKRLDPTTSEAIAGVDFLARLFLDLECRAADAYARAWRVDQPLEDARLTMLTILNEIGQKQPDGTLGLAGKEFEIRLTFGDSNYFDPELVKRFRGALLRTRLHELAAKLFAGTMSWSFKPEARVILENLPKEIRPGVLAQFEACRSRTPLLSVTRVGVM